MVLRETTLDRYNEGNSSNDELQIADYRGR